MLDTIWLEEMTWPEVERALLAGWTTAIVTAGSIEQHGPHLPFVTDTALSEVVAEQFARRIGQAVVAPVIRPGCSEHHMAFPGTISYPPALLQEMVVVTCRCLAHHGFRRLVLMATHGGNFGPVAAAAQQAAAELAGQDVEVISLTDLAEFAAAMMAPLKELGIPQEVTVNHADVSETSFMLVARPELVRLELAEPGFCGEFDTADLLARGSEGGGLRRLTANGVLGDPRGATPEIGRRVIAALVDYMVDKYRQATGEG